MLNSPNFKQYPTTEALPVSPDIKLWVRAMLDEARRILADGELMPVFFVRTQGALGSFVGGEPKVAIIMAKFEGETMREVEKSKDAIADQVRVFARKESADAIMFFSEAWSLREDDAKEYYGNPQKYPGGMKDHPRRLEILSTSLELIGRQYIATTEIKNRQIGEIEWIEPSPNNIQGRFVGLLPKVFKPFAQPPNAH